MFLANNAERQLDLVWSCAADTGREWYAFQLTAVSGRFR